MTPPLEHGKLLGLKPNALNDVVLMLSYLRCAEPSLLD